MTLLELVLSLVIISGTIIAFLFVGLGKKSQSQIAKSKQLDLNPSFLQNKYGMSSSSYQEIQKEIEKQLRKLSDHTNKSHSDGKNKKERNKNSTAKNTPKKKSKAKKNIGDDLILS